MISEKQLDVRLLRQPEQKFGTPITPVNYIAQDEQKIVITEICLGQ